MSKHDFPLSEFQARHKRVRVAMEEAGIDLLMVLAPIHINYLIGTPAKGYQEFQVLFFPVEPGPLTILTRLPEVPMLRAESLAEEVRGWGGREPEDPIEAVSAIMREKGYLGRRIGLEVPYYYVHPYEHRKLADLLGDSLVMDATDLIGRIKLAKSPAEVEYVRRAAGILDKAMDTCLGSIAAGKTERQVSADVHHTLLASGSDIPASPMNFLTGPRTAYAHAEPSDRVIAQGDFMHIQFGAHVRRYCCTIGRQLCLGEPTPRMRALYQVAAVGAAFPPSWVEPLLLEGGSPYTLEAGMVIAVEPPLFGLEDGLGVRIIDNVLVTETGAERLCRTTRDLIVL
jgi:Xaa-Pro dipeptidase